MQLIGMLDSPYVRRVAVSLQLLGLPFEHRSLSVFRAFDEFRRINPVVKAPTLVCDDGTVLMDSTLILEYAESIARPRSLMPSDPRALQQTLRVLGLALAGCEKAVQLVYERNRPAGKQHEPWVERVTGQMLDAFRALEDEIASRPLAIEPIDQAGITTAAVWEFTQKALPGAVPPAQHPSLVSFARKAEALAAFTAAPHGDGTCRASA
jgi:glutathione S-transferase